MNHTDPCPACGGNSISAMPPNQTEKRWAGACQCNACGRRWERAVRTTTCVRLSRHERLSIAAAAQRDRQPMSAWMRDAAVEKAGAK